MELSTLWDHPEDSPFRASDELFLPGFVAELRRGTDAGAALTRFFELESFCAGCLVRTDR